MKTLRHRSGLNGFDSKAVDLKPGARAIAIAILVVALPWLACQRGAPPEAGVLPGSESSAPSKATRQPGAGGSLPGPTLSEQDRDPAVGVGDGPIQQGDAPQPARDRSEEGDRGTEVSLVPSLLYAEGKPLPQTEEQPSADSASLRHRLELLTRAIAENKPEIGLPAFFPVEAYIQVKAIEHPERDYQKRLVRAFERNIAEYHKRLGAAAAEARFVRLEIPESTAKWMKPGSEGNRVGYYRVLRSKLVLALTDGEERALELTSMISWRGEWYVVHLKGFK